MTQSSMKIYNFAQIYGGCAYHSERYNHRPETPNERHIMHTAWPDKPL